MKRHLLLLSVLALAVAGCGGQRDSGGSTAGADPATVNCAIERDTRIGIATGNTTGVYFPLGGAYAEAINTSTGGRLRANAAETGASVQNIQQLVAGDYQVAFALADSAADAVRGMAAFDGEPQPIAALGRIYSNYTQVVVRTDAGIDSVADMRGKRISTGSPRSGTEVIANRLLVAAGLDPDSDLAAQRLDLTRSVDGMKDGSIDGLFFSGGLPTPGILDLFTTAGEDVKLLDITELLPEMRDVTPVYEPGTIPAATYSLAADVPTIVVPNVLLVRDDLDAGTACVLTKVLFERKDALVAANPAAEGIELARAEETGPIPLHPGARKAIEELGGS